MTCQKTWSGTENKVDHNQRKGIHGVIKRLQKAHGVSTHHGTHKRIDRSWTELQIINHFIVSSQKKYLNCKSHP